jgi:protein-tyrosine phosphatase
VSPPEGARILFVCTANICRSVYAEYRLRAALQGRAGETMDAGSWSSVSIGSAGIRGLSGLPMDRRMMDRLGELASAAASHVARQLVAEDIESADVILTATRDHRRSVVQLRPTASGRVFTLNEFVRLLENAEQVGAIGMASADDHPGDFVRRVITAAAKRRGMAVAPPEPTDDDIDDPYRLAPEAYRRAADALDGAVDRMVSALDRTARGVRRALG